MCVGHERWCIQRAKEANSRKSAPTNEDIFGQKKILMDIFLFLLNSKKLTVSLLNRHGLQIKI